MGKHRTIAWACFCFGLISLVTCSRTHHRRQMKRNSHYEKPGFYPHHHRRSSIYQRSAIDNFDHQPQIENNAYLEEMEDEDWLKEGEPIRPGVLVEDITEDDMAQYEKVAKREAPDRGFYEETKKVILDLHNLYRSNVTPPAANMAHMEWDDELAYFAQLWADNCVFEHGTPPNTEYSRGIYGQNLYLGHDPTALNAMFLWYDEYRHYNLKTLHCQPKQQCGHYVQMGWSNSDRLGCGLRKCGMRYLIVCHYHGPAIMGQQMYTVGKTCSQCPDERGSLCRNNLCFSFDQCNRMPHLCAEARCNLQCHNCGRLDSKSCRCDCADGFDSPDCSRQCANLHERCGMNPGFPDKSTCSLNRHAVEKKYCRKMCGKCNPIVKGYTFKFSCCDGKVCDDGSVLDGRSCKCTKLCPGPECDSSGFCIRNRALHLFILIIILYLFRYT